MNESDLIDKLKEIEDCKQKIIKIFRENIENVNLIIIYSLDEGDFLNDTSSYIPGVSFSNTPINRVKWNTVGFEKKVFFLKNEAFFDVSTNASSFYIKEPFLSTKVQVADDDIIIEYISFVLSQKKVLMQKLKGRAASWESMPKALENFMNESKSEIKNNFCLTKSST
jgi:hypothetical protein